MTPQTLSAELAGVQQQCPGWHLWISRDGDQPSGQIYATHVLTIEERTAVVRAHTPVPYTFTADAVTLTPASVVVALHEIKRWEHEHRLVAA